MTMFLFYNKYIGMYTLRTIQLLNTFKLRGYSVPNLCII